MNLAAIRKQKGISQVELAKHLGVVRSTICQYEKEKNEPDLKMLVKIADYFDISVDELLGRKHIDLFSDPNEELLLKYFHMLTDDLQEVAIETVRALAGARSETNVQKNV